LRAGAAGACSVGQDLRVGEAVCRDERHPGFGDRVALALSALDGFLELRGAALGHLELRCRLLVRLDLGFQQADLLARLGGLLLREDAPLLALLHSMRGGSELAPVPPPAGEPHDRGRDGDRDRDRHREQACLSNVHEEQLRTQRQTT
jgi:hypothetical protein